MKVKLLTSRSGPDLSQTAGETVTVDKDEAQRLIEAGQAEPVTEKRETATKANRETREDI